MSQSLELALIRVYDTNQRVIGTAFLVDDTRAITCAHVIQDSQRVSTRIELSSQLTVKVDFPLIHQQKDCFARVSFLDYEKDLAGLELTSDPPAGAQPVRLVLPEDELWGHDFRAFGFSIPEGVWASGVLRGKNAEGWIQIEDTKSVGYSIQPGFSGAPVWDEKLQAVVGMIVAADQNQTIKAGFCIPCESFASWDVLRNRVKPARQMGSVFLSYKRNAQPDQQITEVIATELTKIGYTVFTDLDIRQGENWLNRIDEEIADSDFLIVFLSNSSAESEMVQSEIFRAYEYRKKNGNPQILPVRVSYKSMLPYSISAFLNPLQYVVWDSSSDNARVINELIQAMKGHLLAQEHPPSITEANSDNIIKPTPVFDPRVLDELHAPGGAVRLQDKFYIERTEDKRLRNEIKRLDGTTVTIRAARQSGKSSLLVRGMQQAKQADAKTILLDLQRVGKDHLTTSDIFMRYFAEFLGFKLSLEIDKIDKYWHRGLSPQEKLTSLIEDYILEDLEQNIFIGMDEIDRLLETHWHAEFFGLLRSWHNLRATDERWQKLSILMVISTEPYLLIADANQSPFNVGTNLYLQDFNAEQVQDLSQRHGNPVNDLELGELTRFFGGHPYLTRKAFYLMVVEGMKWKELMEKSTDDLGPFGDHLRRYHWLIQTDPALKMALKSIIRNDTCEEELVHRLLQAGLIKSSGDYISCRCEMYWRYFREKL